MHINWNNGYIQGTHRFFSITYLRSNCDYEMLRSVYLFKQVQLNTPTDKDRPTTPTTTTKKTTRRKLNNKRKESVIKVSFFQHFAFVRHDEKRDPQHLKIQWWIYTDCACVCTQCLLKFNFLITKKKKGPRLFHFFYVIFFGEYNKKDKMLVKRQFHLMLYNSMCHSNKKKTEKTFFHPTHSTLNKR